MKETTPTDYKIPVVNWPSNAGGYGGVHVDKTDSRYAEPLVNILDFAVAGESYYARTDGQNRPYNTKIAGSLSQVWVRTGVVSRLVKVNNRLRPLGVELFVWDGYRSIDTQRGLWRFFEAQAEREMPDSSADQRRAFVLNYVSDPSRFVFSDSTTWPVHTTGGAVDLTLRQVESDRLLDMGAGFDEMRAISHSDALERAYLAGTIRKDYPPLNNRRLLHWAMVAEGFINYPLEFWHFDLGDQMYVHNLTIQTGHAPVAAWYGYVESPETP